MSQIKEEKNATLIPADGKDLTRRNFVRRTSLIMASTFALENLASCNEGVSMQSGSAQLQTPAMRDTIPVELAEINDKSERKTAPAPAPVEPGHRTGYAIVGLGHLSLEQILPAFAKSRLCKPVALISGDHEKASKVAAQYGIDSKNIYNYGNFNEVRTNPAIEAVYIVLPNGLHEEYTTKAFAAGKHVLCEKPMATSSQEAERMIAAGKKAAKKLMIAYRIQYEPKNHVAMSWVRSGEHGKVKIIELMNTQNQGDPKQWRLNKKLSGGGALPDIGLYCLNTARYLTGLEPEAVLASIYSAPNDPRFKEVEESLFFQLFFPDGTRAVCTTSYGVHESRKYRCLTDKGAWFGLEPAFAYKGLQLNLSEVKASTELESRVIMDDKDQFAQELDHFSECIRSNREPYTPGEEGLQDHRLMEAIYESAAQNKLVWLSSYQGKDHFRMSNPRY